MLRAIMLQRQRFFSIPDLIVLLLIATSIYSLALMGSEWRAEYNPVNKIDLSFWMLPYYTLLSGVRGLGAYLLSLLFSLSVGYAAAKSKRGEMIIIPILDILQSIPVLGFLPPLILGLVSIFPGNNIGLELACLIAIFTGQVWNMTFSFYSSLRSIPNDFVEATTMMGLSPWQKLIRVELPFSAVALAWNSLLSMAGGWFFLTVSEAVTLGEHEYRLPGIGSYMATAIAHGNVRAMFGGVFAMILLILVMDILIWRPILAWVQRFRLEDVPGAGASEPLMRLVIRESRILRMARFMFRRIRQFRKREIRVAAVASSSPVRWAKRAHARSYPFFVKYMGLVSFLVSIALISWGAFRLFLYLSDVPLSIWVMLLRNSFWTFLRVFFSVALSTLWAVPVGIWIGISAKRVRMAQPVIQIFASFPAPMLYPVVLSLLFKLGFNFDFSSMFLMFLGVQWYVLFNVLAGALRIPQELRYAMDLMKIEKRDVWTVLFLPSVFPALVTGWVTAAGGAWNASVVAEYILFQDQILKTGGLGATIAEATASENFQVLAAGLTLMVFFVLLINRFVWTPLYRLAQTRYRLEV